MANVRVRFAPSPTGFLHIGGARTALFNWLYARHTGGTFVLRIEDTDTARNSQAAIQVIFDGLRWLGLDWDEGPSGAEPTGPSKGACGPYFQSQRGAIYRRRVEQLKATGHAYDHEGAVKFRMPRDPIIVPDLVVGEVRREPTDREALDPDFVIVRSDGQPVFHLVNVVDDIEMGITHVIRGEDHLSNTPKHIALYRAFGAEPPRFAHIPLILNPGGSKMSKRDEGATMDVYLNGGYVPEAVLNYLCLLGWSPKNDREILGREEVVALFDLPQILRHNARFDAAKLQWLNAEYLKAMPIERFVTLSTEPLRRAGVEISNHPQDYVARALATCREKVKTLNDLAPFCDFYFTDAPILDPAAAAREFVPEARPRVERLRAALSNLEPFAANEIESCLKSVAAGLGLKVGLLIHPTRLACTGRTIGPSLYHLMEVLGRDRVLARLDSALERMQSQATPA